MDIIYNRTDQKYFRTLQILHYSLKLQHFFHDIAARMFVPQNNKLCKLKFCFNLLSVCNKSQYIQEGIQFSQVFLWVLAEVAYMWRLVPALHVRLATETKISKIMQEHAGMKVKSHIFYTSVVDGKQQ
jgi:hypothetical protein